MHSLLKAGSCLFNSMFNTTNQVELIFDIGYDNLRRTTLKRWEDDSGTLGNGNRVVGFQHLQDKDGDGNVDEPGYDRMNNKLLEEKTHDTDNSTS